MTASPPPVAAGETVEPETFAAYADVAAEVPAADVVVAKVDQAVQASQVVIADASKIEVRTEADAQAAAQYLKVDEKAIRAAMNAGVRDIPGVTIELVTDIAVKTR